MVRSLLLAVAITATTALAPKAATVTVVALETFALGNAAGARAALDAYVGAGSVGREETFEGAAVDAAANTYVSPTVGTFTGLGGVGSGGSNIAERDRIQIRSTTGNIFGRQNLTPGGTRYLDSNDTLGWIWRIEAASLGLSAFTDIAFLLMDAGDQGATFALGFGDDTLATITGRPNGAIDFIALSFAAPTTVAELRFANTVRRNDGFGLDQVRVIGEVAAIPLPATVLLLGVGLLALGLLRRARA